MGAKLTAVESNRIDDGIIQTILEKIGVSYIGSGPQASRNALNKIMAQEIFKQNNIPVADFWIVDKTVKNDFTKFIKEFNDFPVVVKPSSEGSSIGITLVKEKKELKQALSLAFKYGPQVLIERYIKGREMTVGILDEKALPAIEIVPKRTFFDFTAKYQQGLTEYIVPAQLPQDLANLIQQVALSAHQALGCRHFSRVDIMLDGNNHPFVLEVNTIPGFTATSLLPKAAKVAGMNFAELCLKLISLANGKEK